MFAQSYYNNNMNYPNMNYYGGYPQGYPPQMQANNGYGFDYMMNPPAYNPPPITGYNQNPYPQMTSVYQTQQSTGGGYQVYTPTQSQYSNPNSPFINPQLEEYKRAAGPEFQEYVPGRNITGYDSMGNAIPITRNGQVVNPQYASQNNNRSGFVYEGGYNPVTGVTTPQNVPLQPAGSNPYASYAYNPQMRYQMPPSGQFGRYTNYYNPFVGYYMQTEYDSRMNELIYDAPIEAFDAREGLAHIVLTDAELEEARTRNARGYYNDYYAYNAKMQKWIEDQRRNQQEVFTCLSRIAHVAAGEVFDQEMEERARYIHDPMRAINERNRKLEEDRRNFYSNPDRQEYAMQMQHVAMTNSLAAMENYFINQEEQRHQKVLNIYKQIQDSHSRLMGFEPGYHYTLQEYLDNAGIIVSRNNIEAYREYSRKKNAKRNQYNPFEFKAGLAKDTNTPVTLTKDDIPFAEDDPIAKMRMQGVFNDPNGKDIYPMIVLPDGSVAYGKAPPGRDQEEYIKNLFEEANKRKHEKLYPNRAVPDGV